MQISKANKRQRVFAAFTIVFLFGGMACGPDPIDMTTVRQEGTDLEWLRCPLGEKPTDDGCFGIKMFKPDGYEYSFDEATRACPAGYRLPTRQEMRAVFSCEEEPKRDWPECKSCSESPVCSRLFGKKTGSYWTDSNRRVVSRSSEYTGANNVRAHVYAIFARGMLVERVETDLKKNVLCVRTRK